MSAQYTHASMRPDARWLSQIISNVAGAVGRANAFGAKVSVPVCPFLVTSTVPLVAYSSVFQSA